MQIEDSRDESMATVIRFALYPDKEFHASARRAVEYYLGENHAFYKLTEEFAARAREVAASPDLDDDILRFLFFGMLCVNDGMQQDFTRTTNTNFVPLDVKEMSIFVQELTKLYNGVLQMQYRLLSDIISSIKTLAMARNKRM